jgi:hypothetical protein
VADAGEDVAAPVPDAATIVGLLADDDRRKRPDLAETRRRRWRGRVVGRTRLPLASFVCRTPPR